LQRKSRSWNTIHSLHSLCLCSHFAPCCRKCQTQKRRIKYYLCSTSKSHVLNKKQRILFCLEQIFIHFSCFLQIKTGTTEQYRYRGFVEVLVILSDKYRYKVVRVLECFLDFQEDQPNENEAINNLEEPTT
jgi:hypothetical protein